MLIYLIRNKVNDKVYVGQTTQKLYDRWSDHKGQARRGNTAFLYRAIRKYGPANFSISEFCNADSIEKLHNLEKLLIIVLRSNNNHFGYNMAEGGNRPPSRRGIPGWNKGKKWSEEHKARLRGPREHVRGTGRMGRKHGSIPWNKGQKGILVSPRKGKKTGKPAWNKGLPSPFKGIPRSAEIKFKVSEKLKAAWQRRKRVALASF